ncbi:MAG: MFS transporter [Ilumatobacteraceae bacterium]
MASVARNRSRTFASLKFRNYRLFAGGSFLSNIGTWLQRVAQDWLVLTLTGSAGALGITTGLQFLPTLLFSPFAGVLADRYAKRIVLNWTQSIMGITALVMGIMAVTHTINVWHVYVLTFLFGTASALDIPARQAFVNEMVDDTYLANAVGLNSASFNLARMIGPALAGVLIALGGSGVAATGWVIMLNGVSYGAVIISLMLMRQSEMRPTRPIGRAKGQLRDGVRYVRSRPDIMLILVIVFCAGTFGFNFQMTTALMATEVFHKGAGEYGLLGSILAIGSLGGSLVAARRARPRQAIIIGCSLAFGIVEIASGLAPSYLTFAISLPLCGVTSLLMIATANAFVQMSVSAEMRGRVMALYMCIFMGGTPLGAPVLGWVAEQWGARWTLIGGGGLTALGTLLATLFMSRNQGVRFTPHLRPRPGFSIGHGEGEVVAETVVSA